MAVSLVGWQTRETRGESEPSWVGNRGFKILVVSGVLHGSMLSFFYFFFYSLCKQKCLLACSVFCCYWPK